MSVGLVRGWTKHLTPPVAGWQRTDPLDRGLVGEWRFDPITGLLLPDYSGRGNHGTVVGPDWVTARYGPALDFDGDTDHVNVPRSSAIEPPSAVTVECFYYYPGVQAAWERIIAKDKNTDDAPFVSYMLGFANANNVTYFAINEDATYRETSYYTMPAVGWYHLVGTWSSGDNLRYYVQGKQEEVSAAAYVGAITYYEAPLRFMRHSTVAGYSPAGKLALVRVYDRALSAAEVRARYQICLKRAQPLAHVWMMPWGMAPVAPPVGPFLTTYAGYSVPVG